MAKEGGREKERARAREREEGARVRKRMSECAPVRRSRWVRDRMAENKREKERDVRGGREEEEEEEMCVDRNNRRK